MEDAEEFDESVYIMYHKAETGFPSLSFDIIKDNLGSGEERANQFPYSLTLVAGSQAASVHLNQVMVVKMSKLSKLKQDLEEEEAEEEEDSESEEEEATPELECAPIPHNGCVNRIRATQLGEKHVAASWSELGLVYIWDLSQALQAVEDVEAMTHFTHNSASIKPMFTFRGHNVEGFALDWSSVTTGLLASGDCNKNIHVWKPAEAYVWHVDQQPLHGHTKSVEDLQWSPNECNVLASCSVDQSVRIWDIRNRPSSSCVIAIENAHPTDVNVISWNKKETQFLLSGADDGNFTTCHLFLLS